METPWTTHHILISQSESAQFQLRLVSFLQRAKPPAPRPVDHLILDRQREDAARDQVLEFTRNQKNYDTKNLWLKKSERRFLRGAVDREVKAAARRHESDISEKRRR